LTVPFAELALARGDGRYARILRGLTGVQLLILDDWGLEPLDGDGRRPSSPAKSRSTNGTPLSATPHTPTPSSTASFTTPIASISLATA
jgi:hypothetical protein